MSRIENIPTEVLQLVTSEQAWHYRVVPKMANRKKMVFLADKAETTSEIIEELSILFDREIELDFIPPENFKAIISRHYQFSTKNESNRNKKTKKIKAVSDDLLIDFIKEAHQLKSSDIHFEIYENKCRIRFRIDGKLIEKYILSKTEYPALVNKVKIKANLDIAEKRLPQDGRIIFNEDDAHFDIRVSVIPTLHGEKIVLRLLSKDAADIDINQLGFSPEQQKAFLEAIKKPYGILLISGPTGSGKTTTLYATLKILNQINTNILTIEDPIEYTLEGINQVQLKEQIGLTFSSALRAFLRQDPDIIMLGEIRDSDTAQMAIRAALTGHFVLSTIHTNSAWGTVSRLIDMGIPPYLISSTLNLTAAQRLVRMLCPECKKQEDFNPTLLPKNFKPPVAVDKQYKAVGCEHCNYTGYKGRRALYETIPVDKELSERIKNSETNIEDYIKENNIEKLKDIAFELFLKGETSLEEVYAILMSEH